ncbi:hypothetical protein [uncultured Pseudokineococcus sp.]|uniref:hypothetical protein n=1 Tax=uncultured Pseudokineococcus sp. TaxID=1642928 RepID=UPI00260C37A0|nr:hypothetical protein [uncultured Pseudokineococcus sp.]
MTAGGRRRLAGRRLRPGDGRPLPPFRWWQVLGRSVMHLDLSGPGQRGPRYAVDVRHGGDGSDGEVRARLYRDGRQEQVSKVPAVFPVAGGVVEVAVSAAGLRRCHHVTDDGTEHPLVPDSRSAAGHRARLDRHHPALGRSVGVVSVLLLILGLGLNLLQLVEPLSEIPPVAEALGATFDSPVDLPVWLNVALGLGAGLGSAERALRLRYRSWLDGAGT